ncbi:hypothetical protein C7S16_4813 [Burkholderia thailandensis]|uniref:Uncharacterized protein n=1 Tax=Burkholderia thailandensis TaxID=57975 RepID=A0AAW9CSK7_BURTH|nr:hypothetical protein [Burkholderia thailandensis]MDW9252801.1 hypothetical protein [Burkholderia thailandensis]
MLPNEARSIRRAARVDMNRRRVAPDQPRSISALRKPPKLQKIGCPE